VGSDEQSANQSAPVLISSAEGVLEITLNRPERRNAVDGAMAAGLLRAFDEQAREPAVRAVLISGAGGAFCAGADLADLREHREATADRAYPEGTGADAPAEIAGQAPPDVRSVLERRYHPLLRSMRTIEKPVLCAVQGPAVGIGCSLALTCDLVLASESAYFSLIFSRIGLVPDGGASLLVPLRAGVGRFLEMAMLGERIGAEQALAWGLINRVCAEQELGAQAQELARRLAAGPTLAYGGIKRELGGLADDLLERALAREAQIQQEMASSADAAEGILAFLTKRAPVFRGS
jgi:2-(1,2-epoxy-1,2-dihydrophenyl)acetyl-CoA isomerase